MPKRFRYKKLFLCSYELCTAEKTTTDKNYRNINKTTHTKHLSNDKKNWENK